ncbi:ATP-binding protein [Amaricoccus macauensis]|uniref:ATP-binding protein n=1 Tax=Amaricoccus macauensis TaxID=57001 RepID=UPI003C7A6055
MGRGTGIFSEEITEVVPLVLRKGYWDAARRREIQRCYHYTLQTVAGLSRDNPDKEQDSINREALICMVELLDTLAALDRLSCDGRGGDIQRQLQLMARQAQQLSNGNVKIELRPSGSLDLPVREKTLVLLIAHEAILNAFKHAFPDDRTGTIGIRLALRSANRAKLVVWDDGVGAAGHTARSGSHKEETKPRGAIFMQTLTGLLGGVLTRGTAQNNEGHRVELTWPL